MAAVQGERVPPTCSSRTCRPPREHFAFEHGRPSAGVHSREYGGSLMRRGKLFQAASPKFDFFRI
jgi:hypothetical protein